MIASESPGGFFIARPEPIEVQRSTEAGITLMSDLHLGATHVDYKRIERDLKDALEHGDRILINGDVFDFILPSDHKRFSPDALHSRLRGRRDILNACLEWAVEMFTPYAHLIDMVGIGNHETSVEKHHSADIVAMLCDRLSAIAGRTVSYGGYTGYVDYRFRRGGPSSDTRRLVIYYHHGTGGQAPVTKGLIGFHRSSTWVDSDIIWHGHRHNRLVDMTGLRLRCPLAGDSPTTDQQVAIMTGAYMVNYTGQSQADFRERGRRAPYASDWGLPPQGMGGARVLVRFPKAGGKEIRVLQ